ncbi:MAG: ATP-binding protein [Psychromonas sp.]
MQQTVGISSNMEKGARLQANADSLAREIAWFSEVLTLQLQIYFVQGAEFDNIYQLPAPVLHEEDSCYAKFVCANNLDFNQRIILILAIIPHIKPYVLDPFFSLNANFDRCYAEFGGKEGVRHRGFLPTVETAVFILAGDDLARRLMVLACFEQHTPLIKQKVLQLDDYHANEPFASHSLNISEEYYKLFTEGAEHKPNYSNHFPAILITSQLDWRDLILAPVVMDEIDKITTWIEHAPTILHKWGLDKSLKPGYRCLFYGPPGTGKTLSATLIGGKLGLDVYRIDLSSMVSKYIGETEKNLANLFDQAQNKQWILFFDEADALFGTRSQGSSANERHANQQVAYLLQRIEDFPGVVILATNLRGNIDGAFSRRFQSLIYFPMPDEEQRLQLWQSMLNGHTEPGDDKQLHEIAVDYELAGGAIANVVRYAAICALQHNSEYIQYKDIKIGINKELKKEGKTI